MTILLVAHTKGGVCKTTTVLNLAVRRASAGRRVLLVESDRGLSLTKALTERAKRADLVQIRLVARFGLQAHLEILEDTKYYDDILIDAGGEGVTNPEIALIMSVADRVLTPCRPSAENTVRLENIYELVTSTRRFRPQLKAMLFPVAASTHPNANDVAEFYAACAPYVHYELIDAVTTHRNAYMGWARTGEAVAEARHPDPKAVAEIEQLYAEVFHD